MQTLVGQDPREILPHGPTKLLVDSFLWHDPDIGIVAAYTPKPRDVEDHFGVFRGVDQVESFGQACVVSCSVFLDAAKMGLRFEEYYQRRNFVFAGVERVHCHGFIRQGETFVCLGLIQQYKFRQMTVSGRIYKAPATINLPEYFKHFSSERLKNFEIADGFEHVFDIHNIIGKGIKNEKFQH
ncbi:MAG: hypothetical protein WCR52_21185 [Bacteroidota bacterium]